MKYIEVDIEIGSLFEKLGLTENIYNTDLYSEVPIQVCTPKNEWVDVNSFIKKPLLPMVQITLENGVMMRVANKHILQENGKDIFAIDATCIDTLNGPVKIISKEHFGEYDAYDISIPSPHLYADSYGVIHHNSESIRQACAKSKRELVYFNVTNETTEEDLMGSFILEDGNMVWKDGPVIIAMRRGAVLLLDECDNLSTSAMTLQSVLQNEPYYVKKTNEMVEPQEGFTVVATANTKGDGDGGDRFIGANVLNEAFLERFNIVYTQEYPPLNIEMKILQNYSKDNKLCAKLVRWANVIRKGYYDGSIERCLTTRRLIQIVKNISVLKSDKDGIEYALNRFDEATKKAMMLAYESLSSQPYDDGLDELAGTMADVVDADGLESAITANSADVDDSEFKNKMQTDYLSNNPDADKIRKELEANFI